MVVAELQTVSRAERKHLEIEDTKRRCCAVYGSMCFIKECDLQATQLGHVLPQDTVHIQRYGEDLIHHWSNQRPTCGTEHNRQVQINYRGHPIAADEHAARVRKIMEEN